MHRLGRKLTLLLAVTAPAVLEASVKVICFGDSITYGDFDGGFGYPGRLQERLDMLGFDTVVVNSGENGEETIDALSRIQSVLDANPGGGIFLLMEGTNDISRGMYSRSDTLFNLDVIADAAEAAGYTVAHASLLPRYPCATKDVSNVLTFTLGDDLASDAVDAGRPFVDVFGTFFAEVYFDGDPPTQNIPAFEYFYNNYSDPCSENEAQDPVGHPNTDHGYPLLTDPFEDLVVSLLSSATIAPPPPPTVGEVVTFGAQLFLDDFTELEWDFGDGGRALISPVGPNPTADYMYIAAGDYTVTLRWKRSGGESGSSTSIVHVSGSQSWATRTSLVQLANRGAGPSPDDLRFDLDLINASGEPAIAEVSFLSEPTLGEPLPLVSLDIVTDSTPPTVAETVRALRESLPDDPYGHRRFYVGPESARSETDLLGRWFGATEARTAAKVVFFRASGSTDLAAAGTAYRDGFLASGAAVSEIESNAWSYSDREFTGLEPTADLELRVAVTNPTLVSPTIFIGDIRIQLDLFDAKETHVGTYEMGVLRHSTTTGALSSLFPALGAYTSPFRLTLHRDLGTRPYVATLSSVSSTTGEVDEIPPSLLP